MVQDDIGHPGEVWVRRKLLHITIGTILILCMMLDDRTKWFFIIVLAGGIALSLAQERGKLPVITWILDRYDKKADMIPGQGPVTFFVGTLLVWFIFGGDLALAGVIALSFGDPTAYVMGRSIPGPKLPWNRRKSVIGSISFMVPVFLLIWLLWAPLPALMIAVSASIAESLPFPKSVLLDDNVVIPVVSSTAGYLLLDLLPSML